MSLSALGFCGVDDSVDVELLRQLSSRYPYVEFAVLFNEGKEGTPRHPTAQWVKQLTAAARSAEPPIRLAGHLCGGRCTELLSTGDTSWVKAHLVKAGFGRIQINATKINGVEIADMAAARRLLMAAIDEVPELEWIIQANEETKPLWEPLMSAQSVPNNVSILFDASCGTGELAESFTPPPRNGLRSGYAGGLGPETVREVLQALRSGAARGHTIWIDMETRIRSTVDGEDRFDVAKAQAVCEIVEAEGWDQLVEEK